MIIVKISAGLGNQMFQYALGRRLSLDWQDELKFDLSWFNNIKKGDIPRKLEIDKFNIFLKEATTAEAAKLAPGLIKKIIKKVRGRLNRNFFYQFYPRLLRKRKAVYLDGYFQSYKYFNPIRETLLADFSLKNGFSPEGQKIKNDIELTKEAVALHIRRGDYATSQKGYHGLCNLKYYEKALGEINKKNENAKLFIFSDDIAWAKNNLTFNQTTVFVSRPNLNDAEELILMSLCQHQIIANSTFSWWAAWLNKNPEKIIIAPKLWLAATDINTSDLLPSDWLKI
jgi:hypothetical protein